LTKRGMFEDKILPNLEDRKAGLYSQWKQRNYARQGCLGWLNQPGISMWMNQ
jgi:hypothetical protein